MAREGITFEQVAAAAGALVGEGQQAPTIRAVREKLGTGSPNTIHKHLTAWREARPVVAAAAPELPQALTAAIAAEIERAASRARGEIEARLVQAQSEAAELAAAGEVLEGERDELVEQVVALASERDTLAGKAQQQAAEIERLRADLAGAQQGRTAAEQQAAVLVAKLEACADRVSRAEARQAQAEQQAAKAAQAREQAARLAGQLEALQRQRQQDKDDA
jgi:chromosome segregation ATPase